MGPIFSSLGSRSSRAWWDEWPQTTSASAQQRARLVDDFEGVEPDQEEPVTVAQVLAFEAERERQWRGPDPAGLPPRWKAASLQLWADITQQVERVRQSSTPPRQIRSAPDDNAELLQPHAAPNHPGPNRASSLPVNGTTAHGTYISPDSGMAANNLGAAFLHQYTARQLGKLDAAFLSDYLRAQGYAAAGEYSGSTRNPVSLGRALPDYAREYVRSQAREKAYAMGFADAQDEAYRKLRAEPSADAEKYVHAYVEKHAKRYARRYATRFFEEYAKKYWQEEAKMYVKGIAALHQHLAPARAFAGDPASLARLDASALRNMTQHAAQQLGFYGAHDGEKSDPKLSRQYLIKLVSSAIGCVPAPYWSTVDGSCRTVKRHVTIARIKETEISRLQAFGLTREAAEWAYGVAWAEVDPTLVRADVPGDMIYASLAWADLKTGMNTAEALGLEHWSMNSAELVALALTGDITARTCPDAAAAMQRRNVLTALTYAGISIERDDPDAGKHIERALTTLNDAYTARWKKAQRLNETLEVLNAPMPLRSQMATERLKQYNIDPEKDVFLPGSHPRHPGNLGSARTAYLNGYRSSIERNLPDIDEEFDEVFTEYTSNFTQAVKSLFDDIVQMLPEQDRTFWQHGTAQVLEPKVTPDLHGMQSVSPSPRRQLTAIIAIRHGRKLHHYLVSASGNGSQPIRRIANDLPGDLSDVNLIALDKTLLPYADDLFTNAAQLKRFRNRIWELRPVGKNGPAISVLAQHFTRPVAALRKQAYEPTGYQKMLRAMLSVLVPFYGCNEDIKDEETTAAVTLASCTMDAVGLIPLIGALGKIGAGGARLGAATLAQLARSGISRQTLHAVSASLTKYLSAGGKTLGLAAVQVFDPGIELLMKLPKLPSTARRAFMSVLRRRPDMRPLAERIHALARRRLFHFNAQADVWQVSNRAVRPQDGRQFAHIDGRKIELIDLGDIRHVPVQRLGSDDAPFALLDPHSGLAYGARWVQTPGGFEVLGDYVARLKGRVPAPNARGIVEFKQRQYIQVDKQYYPVRHSDENGPTWRIYKEHNPSGYAVPVRYDVQQRKWTIHSDVGGRGGRPPAGNDIDLLRNLPEDQRMAVFTRLVEDARTLSSEQSAGLFALLGNRIGRLPEPDRWEAFRLVADATATLRQPHNTMLALATQIGVVAPQRQLKAFEVVANSISSAIDALTAEQYGGLLSTLAKRIGALPEADRWAAFALVAERIPNVTSALAGTEIVALIKTLIYTRGLSAGRQWSAFKRIYDLVYDTAHTLDATELTELRVLLAHQIDALPDAHRLNAFQRIGDLRPGPDGAHPQQPYDVLLALEKHIEWVPPGARWDAFKNIADHVSDAAHTLTGTELTELSRILIHASELLGDMSWAGFKRVCELLEDTADALAGTELAGLIKILTRASEPLGGQRWEAFKHIGKLVDDTAGSLLSGTELTELRVLRAHHIRKLPAEHRWEAFQQIAGPRLGRGGIPYQHPHDVLLALAKQIEFVPPGARWEAFQNIAERVSDSTPTLSMEQHAGLLRELAHRIRELPAAHQWDGFQRVAAANGALRQHGVVLMLARRIESLPSARQWEAFQSVADAADAFAGEQLADLLKALTDRISFLLSPASRWDAFQHIVGAAGKLADAQRVPLFIRLRRRIPILETSEQQAAYHLIDPILHPVQPLPQ